MLTASRQTGQQELACSGERPTLRGTASSKLPFHPLPHSCETRAAHLAGYPHAHPRRTPIVYANSTRCTPPLDGEQPNPSPTWQVAHIDSVDCPAGIGCHGACRCGGNRAGSWVLSSEWAQATTARVARSGLR